MARPASVVRIFRKFDETQAEICASCTPNDIVHLDLVPPGPLSPRACFRVRYTVPLCSVRPPPPRYARGVVGLRGGLPTCTTDRRQRPRILWQRLPSKPLPHRLRWRLARPARAPRPMLTSTTTASRAKLARRTWIPPAAMMGEANTTPMPLYRRITTYCPALPLAPGRGRNCLAGLAGVGRPPSLRVRNHVYVHVPC